MPQTFDDVPPTNVFFDFIEAGVAAKITSGTSKNPPLFSPDDPCTHQQMLVFLGNGMAYTGVFSDPHDARMPEIWADITKTSDFWPHVERATKYGIPGGPERAFFNPGILSPGTTVTRGIAMVWVVRAIKELPLISPTPSFPDDVPANHPYYGYIERGFSLRITKGTSATTFSPDTNLTRAQMMTFIVRAFKIPFVTVPTDSPS